MYAPSATPIIGTSAHTRTLLDLIKVLAGSNSTVLITGESGTGKELVAQALHRQSQRRQAAFVPINCGAIPKDLLESELFGHRKGAFTGAVSDRVGRFEMANGGTLFLDEIGDLPLDMQVKLLRVLQDRCVVPVGATRPVAIDVRVIAATHKNLAQDLAQARFREDLYYRLNVLPCHTAPLRERPEDIPELLVFYAERHAQEGRAPIRFNDELTQALMDYRWPGNVRELSNLVDRFTTLFPGQCVQLHAIPHGMLPPGLSARADRPVQPLARPAAQTSPAAGVDLPRPVPGPAEDMLLSLFDRPGDPPAFMPLATPSGEDSARALFDVPELAPPVGELPTPNVVEEIVCLAQGIVSLPPDGLPLKQQLVRIERSLIEQALQRTNGNVSQTARLLHLQRTTLIEKIQKYELRVGELRTG
ncbi:MAG: Nitrogen assimilation regulatory protein [Pseudomonadota bacterium]